MKGLLITLRFCEGRYHGLDKFQRPEWPPSPARLFQALVSGAAIGRRIADEDQAALLWLEALRPPLIAAPSVWRGQRFTTFVPTNERDKIERGRHKSAKARLNALAGIRISKHSKPLLFDERIPLFYFWQLSDSSAAERLAETASKIAERLYQLGRTIDFAYARGEVLSREKVEDRLAAYHGRIYRPSDRSGGLRISVPFKGALEQLIRVQWDRGSIRQKPKFSTASYDTPFAYLLFDIRRADDGDAFAPQPLESVVAFAEKVRDQAAARLQAGLPDRAALIDRVFIGRDATEADKAQRIRITPLPSIGHAQTERSIRRVVVVIPPDCPIATGDIAWAFSGLALDFVSETGVVPNDGAELNPADDRAMLAHYGIEDAAPARLWRTITPVALSDRAARRRIDPRRMREEAKGGAERLREQAEAEWAVRQALRHAGIDASAQAIRVRREPFAAHGARAEEFALGTRFAKERLWHVEIIFAEPVTGPLMIGDGRYLGLGLMEPDRDDFFDVMELAVAAKEGIAVADGPTLVHAARRALMALARETLGDVPRLFSGHENDGGRAASGRHEHIFLAADDNDGDGRVDRLVVAAPWLCDRTISRPKRAERRSFDDVVAKLETVRAGQLGITTLGRPTALAGRDALVGPARIWESRTPYLATRHAGRRKDVKEALVRDITAECERRGLPRPRTVEILDCAGVPNGGGLSARARLCFATAIQGPLLLGRDSHRGGGLFAASK